MTPIRTTCPYCGVGCGILAFPDGTIRGDPDHPANRGRLCSKGTQLGETIGPEGRLVSPMVKGTPCDWDQALDLVADRFTAAVRDHGPDSVAFYVSGQLLTEDYYVANKLMKGFIGSANIDTNSRLCMASSVAGHKRAFGADTVPGSYEDIELADLVVLVGSNLAWCHPVLYQRLVAAKKARPNMRVVNIDPRRTATSDVTDLHLSVAPDGDAALFNALLCHLVGQGHVDPDYVANHVNGFEDAVNAARKGGDSGLSPEELDVFFTLWASTEKVVTIYSQGVNQSECGTDKVNAILNCHLATGRIGRPGMGPFSVTGQPNAMGGREVGGLANMLANHLDIENPVHRAAVQDFWNSPTICTQPGLKAVDLFNACEAGQIKALWIMSTNPAVSLPDADRVARAISNVPFTVASDAIRSTDTNANVDVLLPAAPWGEKSGTVTNSERCISRQRKFLPVRGDARPDWKIICDVATRMGWGTAFSYENEAGIFREYAALSALGRRFERDFDITGLAGLSDVAYDTLNPVRWPVSQAGGEGGRFFAKGGFYHPDGKARMLPVTPPAPVTAPDAFPLVLNTGRIRDQWHTMTRTALSPRLNQHLGEPFVELHPQDAAREGLADADIARVTTPTGQAILRVKIDTNARPGSAFVPMHWTRQIAPAGRVGPLVTASCDPVSGQPASKGSFAHVTRYDAKWYGFLASAVPLPSFVTSYCATRRTPTGWCAEIADQEQQSNWETFSAPLLPGDCQISTAHLPEHGVFRFAAYQEKTLLATLHIAPESVAVARTHVISLIGTDASPITALAGRPPNGMVDPGATICSCMGVGINTLRAAIRDGVRNVDSLGDCTGAGKSCGSCRPELEALIATADNLLAAE